MVRQAARATILFLTNMWSILLLRHARLLFIT